MTTKTMRMTGRSDEMMMMNLGGAADRVGGRGIWVGGCGGGG